MPKLPGRQSTRKTVALTTDLHVSSYLMLHEDRFWNRICVIEGCDHKMGPSMVELRTWRACSDQALPAYLAVEVEDGWENVGLACPCHVNEVLRLHA